MTLSPALLASGKMDWQTPDSVLELVRQFAPIVLDPCTSSDNPTGAHSFITCGGLEERWYEAGGLVYVNPPYGRELPRWADKCRLEAKLGASIILLVPSRTDTRWWHACEADCAAFALWRGRMTFKGAPSTAPFPSCLFYWGDRAWSFARTFEHVAKVIRK